MDTMKDTNKNGWWRRFGRGVRTIVRVIAAAGLGLLAGYLFDPERGRSRRARLADQAQARLREGVSQVDTTAEVRRAR